MARHKDKEETILNAAFEVFRENGFANASMRDIADKAGLGKGTLYEYFQNKEDLFIQVVTVKTSLKFNELNKRISEQINLQDILNELIKFTLETIEESVFFFKFMMFGEFFGMSCEVKQRCNEIVLKQREESVKLLREQFKKGSDRILKDNDWEFVVDFIPEMIISYCNFKVHIMGDCWLQQQNELDRERMVSFILNGLGAQMK